MEEREFEVGEHMLKGHYNKCMVCGGEYTCLHHYMPKSRSLALRWDQKNAIPICNSCHFKHHKGDPSIHAIVFGLHGFGWHKSLMSKCNEVYKPGIKELEKLIKDLEKLIKEF